MKEEDTLEYQFRELRKVKNKLLNEIGKEFKIDKVLDWLENKLKKSKEEGKDKLK